MKNKVTYWFSTALVAGASLLAAVNYLLGSEQMVQAFAHLGYPPHLRVLLGVAKLLGAIALLVPRFPRIKEWAYAGFTFAWISAFVAHHVAQDGAEQFAPLVLLAVMGVSYATRPERLRLAAGDAAIHQ